MVEYTTKKILIMAQNTIYYRIQVNLGIGEGVAWETDNNSPDVSLGRRSLGEQGAGEK